MTDKRFWITWGAMLVIMVGCCLFGGWSEDAALLDESIPLSEIPERMLAMDDVHSPLTTFNYKKFHYL